MNESLKSELFATLNRATSFIDEILIKYELSELVEVHTAIVGGSIRDLILNKPIKDIDITVTFNYTKNLKVDYKSSSKNKWSREIDDDYEADTHDEADAIQKRSYDILEIFNSDKFSFLHYDLNQLTKPIDATDALICLIKRSFNLSLDYREDNKFNQIPFLPQQARESIYSGIGLNSVLGLNDKNSNYPIELLFTLSKKENFIRGFDFNLCKVFMESVDGLAHITKTKGFIDDSENKTMTYTPISGLTQEKLEKSLFIRYPRLHDKYPDYSLSGDSSALSASEKIIYDYSFNKIQMFENLQKLPIKLAGKILKV